MSDNILKLYPRDPTAAPADLPALVGSLQAVGLMSTPFDYFGAVHYRPGAQFRRLIRFSRSHTVIELRPQEGRLVEAGRHDSAQLCHIGLGEVTSEPGFLGMGNTRTPRCPRCTLSIQDWTAAMGEWYADKPGYRWPCPQCLHQCSPADWDWQKTAAIARFSIEIWGVWEGEARPAERLLHYLATQVASPWDYFYWHC